MFQEMSMQDDFFAGHYEPKPQIVLRDDQDKLVEDTRRSIANGHKRIIVQAPVGYGKTILAAAISKLARDKLKRTLFIAPRRQLVYQATDKFERLGVTAGIIMAGERRFNMPLTQVGSIDTLVARIGRGVMKHPEASLVMVDECHAMFSKARLDFLSHYPIVLGITATPALANGKGMGAFYTDIVQAPSMKWMVDNGHLVPMRYYGADGPDLEKVKLDADGDYQEDALADASDKPELIGSIYRNYKRLVGDRSTLIFSVNRKHGLHIFEEFKSHGEAVEYIDANTLTAERNDMESRVALGITKVIVNIGVMAFGTDWPIFSCVIIARVTRNICAWIQMVGRGSRLHPSKTDCLVIYHGHNFDDLGPIDAPIEWSLDDKTTVRQRKERAQKEAKAPKDITCGDCGFIFQRNRRCPKCGHEMIKQGEPIPYHEADLVELKVKPKPADKQSFYAQLLYIANSKGYNRGWADHKFFDKFKHYPAKKNGIAPESPSEEVINFIKHLNIKNAYSKGAA